MRNVCSWAVLIPALFAACYGERHDMQTSAGQRAPGSTAVGIWRAVLASPGGELPFGLRVVADGGRLTATIHNAEEVIEVERVELEGDTLTLGFDVYDAVIEATLGTGGTTLEGQWRKTTSSGESRLPFTAERGIEHRFGPRPGGPLPPLAEPPALPSLQGDWDLGMVDDDGSWPARAELRQVGARVTGTILTATGDFRYLEGDYRGGRLRLSTFDGAHAFLFHARVLEDGTLAGDFWSRDVYHATFTGERSDGELEMPDPFAEVDVLSPDRRVDVSFPDLDGATVSLTDERFIGKVVLVELFGTWCPNCADQAPLMSAWYTRYRERGLDMIGLAYEVSGDPDRDRRVLRLYRDKHGIEFPLLLAGVSDKAEASKTLPDLSRVKSYPTTLFVGRDGRVRRVYSGFAGPATGAHHRELVRQFEAEIERLLAEPAPPL